MGLMVEAKSGVVAVKSQHVQSVPERSSLNLAQGINGSMFIQHTAHLQGRVRELETTLASERAEHNQAFRGVEDQLHEATREVERLTAAVEQLEKGARRDAKELASARQEVKKLSALLDIEREKVKLLTTELETERAQRKTLTDSVSQLMEKSAESVKVQQALLAEVRALKGESSWSFSDWYHRNVDPGRLVDWVLLPRSKKL